MDILFQAVFSFEEFEELLVFSDFQLNHFFGSAYSFLEASILVLLELPSLRCVEVCEGDDVIFSGERISDFKLEEIFHFVFL